MQAIVVYTYIEVSACFSIFIFCLCLIYLVYRLGFKNFILPALFFFTVSIIAWQGCFAFEKAEQQSMKLSLENDVEIEGTVISKDVIRSSDYNERDYAKLIIENSSIGGNILLNLYSEDFNKITAGDFVRCRGRFEIPKTARNPRGFNYKKYLNSKKIIMIGSSKNIKVCDKSKDARFIIYRYTEHIRDNMFSDIESQDNAVVGLIRGIVLGDKTGIDEDVYNRFRMFGTAHILAVSGLHVGVLLTLYRRLYRIIPNQIITVIIFMILIFYGSITRWSPSVFRAVLMSLVYLLAQITSRDADLLTSLGITSIISVCLNPLVVNSMGFQMSYLAVLGIGILSPVVSRKLMSIILSKFGDALSNDGIRTIVNGLSIYFAVQIVILPYILQEFNYISPMGFLLNLPVTILAGLIITFSIASMFFISIGDLIGYLVQNKIFFVLDNYFVSKICFISIQIFREIRQYIDVIVWGLGKMMMDIHAFAAEHLKSSYDFVSPGKAVAYTLIIGILLCFSEAFFIDFKRKKIRRIVGYFVVLVFVFFSVNAGDTTPFDKANIIMIDVGQGDCVHIRSNRGINMMFDGGGSRNKNIGKLILKPYLLQNRVDKLDLACITHEDVDHSQGIKDLDKIYNIKNLVKGAYVGEIGAPVGELAESSGIKVRVLWPIDDGHGKSGEDNEKSSVFRIDVDGISILVTGDIGVETEKILIDKYKHSNLLNVDVLKVGHHGSKYSTSENFLDAVDPKVALIGVGKNNYGHPSPSVIDKLHKNDIILYRTDVDGAIGLWKEGKKLKICTMLRK